MANITLQVNGMTCGHCVSSVEGALKQLKGIERAEVSLPDKSVTVDYNDKIVTMDHLITAIEDQGYDVVTQL